MNYEDPVYHLENTTSKLNVSLNMSVAASQGFTPQSLTANVAFPQQPFVSNMSNMSIYQGRNFQPGNHLQFQQSKERPASALSVQSKKQESDSRVKGFF